MYANENAVGHSLRSKLWLYAALLATAGTALFTAPPPAATAIASGSINSVSLAASSGDRTVYRLCNGGRDTCGVLIRQFRFDKIWDDHKMGRSFVEATTIRATLNSAIPTDSPTSNAYDYKWERIVCNPTCRVANWVIARAIIEWGDGIDNHGRLVTIYPTAGDRVGNDFPWWISQFGP